MPIIQLMTVENAREGELYIAKPLWEHIEDKLRSLNGIEKTYVCLYKTPEPDASELMLIGGGQDEVYVCSYYNGDEYALVNPDCEDDTETVMVPLGQTTGKEKSCCVTFSQLLAAARYYFEHGIICPAMKWRES